MCRVLRTTMNSALQLNACLDLKGCLMTQEVLDGSWFMWIMRMMSYSLVMILGSKFSISLSFISIKHSPTFFGFENYNSLSEFVFAGSLWGVFDA